MSNNNQPKTLLPCPFCGSDGKYIERFDDKGFLVGYDVGCDGNNCIAISGFDWHLHKTDATEMWNKRVTPEIICRKCSLRQDAVLNQDNSIHF